MDWMDYRERLGIGFNDNEKFEKLKNYIGNHYQDISYSYGDESYIEFCNEVGVSRSDDYSEPLNFIWKKLNDTTNLKEFLAYYIAFVNTYYEDKNYELSRDKLYEILENGLNQFKIPFDLIQDDNQYFVFPKGAEELDRALVSEPLQWLSKYPSAHKTFCNALKQYSDGDYIRDVADNFRKALEGFLKEFLNNTKNLDNNIQEVGKYLKTQNTDDEIVKILVGLGNTYTTLNNKIAKHNDKVDSKYLEFLMYQTGLFIRMLIVVKTEEEQAGSN